MRHSLAARIFASLLLVGLLCFGSLLWYLHNTRDELRYSTLLLQAQEIAQGFTASSDFNVLPKQYAGGELFYTLYDAQGAVLWHSPDLPRPLRMRSGTLDEALRPLRLKSFRGHGHIVGVPVRLADGATLIVSKRDTLERGLIEALLQTRLLHSVIALPLFLLLTGLILWGLMRWTLRPVRRATALAAQIHPDHPERRIPLAHLPKEVLPLAQAANLALDRLDRALTTQKQLGADAAHELRTPLTVLDLLLQRMRHEGTADWPLIEQEMQRLRRLVGQLLTLSRRDHAAHVCPEAPTIVSSLSRLTREAVASLIPLFEQQQRDLEADILDGVPVKGDPDALRDAIRNVVENALLHGQGTVTVRLYLEGQGRPVLDVSDAGPGVPGHMREAIFQRFHKGRQDSAGSGLGLAIARQALHSAGADIYFVSGATCTVRMCFPSNEEDGQLAPRNA